MRPNTLAFPRTILQRLVLLSVILNSYRYFCSTDNRYEVRDLFPWEMPTKTAISCFLNVEKILNSAQINLSSTFNFLLKIFCRHNNIHREIDQWNWRRFDAKWHVTVPNSVTPIKPIVCKLIHMSQGWYCQMTHKLHVYQIFISIFIKLWFREFFFQIHDEKCSFFVV